MSETAQPQATGEGSGERFGDYVLLQKIAQGGMAEVFLAKRRGVEGFEKTVAIKRILPELSWNREFVSMFINEAKIAARLSHPNIVQIFDFGKIDTYYFIAMEYVHGENLRTILQRAEQKKIPLSAEHRGAHRGASVCGPRARASQERRERQGAAHRSPRREPAERPRVLRRRRQGRRLRHRQGGRRESRGHARRVEGKARVFVARTGERSGTLMRAATSSRWGSCFTSFLVGKKLFGQSDPADVLDSITKIDANEVSRSVPGLNRGAARRLAAIAWRRIPSNDSAPPARCRWRSTSICAHGRMRSVPCSSRTSCACSSTTRSASARCKAFALRYWGREVERADRRYVRDRRCASSRRSAAPRSASSRC